MNENVYLNYCVIRNTKYKKIAFEEDDRVALQHNLYKMYLCLLISDQTCWNSVSISAWAQTSVQWGVYDPTDPSWCRSADMGHDSCGVLRSADQQQPA